MFQILVYTIFFYAFLNAVTKTEGGLITDFRKFRGYTDIRSNEAIEKSVQQFRQSKNTAEQDDPLQLIKQLEKSHTPRLTKKSSGTMQLIRYDDRPAELSVHHINNRAGDEGQAAVISQHSSTSCGTRRSVATITRVGDQTADPNTITTPFVPFTPRTRTQPRLPSTGNKLSTKKWFCHEEIEDEPVTDPSHSDDPLMKDITSMPMVVPKYPTPIDPATKFFLKMTSIDKWRRRSPDKCTKPYK